MNRRIVGLLLLAAWAWAASGCSKSAGNGGTPDMGTGGGSSATGGTGGGGGSTAGTGGAGGSTAGTGGGGGSGSGGTGGMAAPTLACGTATCKGAGLLRPCCVDEATSTCGVMGSGLVNIPCGIPAVPDPACPDKPAAMGSTAKGCCTADHVCGSTLAGSPCIYVATDGGSPIACGGADADGGM